MSIQEFLDYARAMGELFNEERKLKIRDDQKNALLTGFYSAMFERQKKIRFPEQMIDEIYKEKEEHEVSLKELKERTAFLGRLKNRRR